MRRQMAATIAIGQALRVSAAAPEREMTLATNTDRATAALATAALEELLPDASREWLDPVAPFFETLIAKAKDGTVTDADFVDFVHAAALEVPELFGTMRHEAVQTALESVIAPAVMNGAILRQFRFDNSPEGKEFKRLFSYEGTARQ
jgi:hypothetical protein